MKADRIRAQVTVTPLPKAFAIIVAIIDTLWGGDREKVIRQLVHWYRVTI